MLILLSLLIFISSSSLLMKTLCEDISCYYYYYYYYYYYSTDINIIKEIKGNVKNQPWEDTEKISAPDGIWTHDPPCSRSDALTSELLRTRWRARVIFVGWTCEPHLAVTQSITSNTFSIQAPSWVRHLLLLMWLCDTVKP